MALSNEIPIVNLPTDKDSFMRELIRQLAGTLEELVGLEETTGFISVVGQSMGEQINTSYKEALNKETFSRTEVGTILIDFKRRISGDFFIESADEKRIVLGNRQCPFGDKVINRPSMCMMTSNVFGVITADNLGYARVELLETIASGNTGCRVVIHLSPAETKPEANSREYFQAPASL